MFSYQQANQGETYHQHAKIIARSVNENEETDELEPGQPINEVTTGTSIAIDLDDIVLYEEINNHNHAQSLYHLGWKYFHSVESPSTSEQEKGVVYYKEAAIAGYLPAQYELSVCYKNGWGIEKNLERALYWCSKAANQGHAKSQYNLGLSFLTGNGVVKSRSKAYTWFLLAAEQHLPEAQNQVGHMLLHSISNPISNDKEQAPDYNQAFQWFQKAVHNNSRSTSSSHVSYSIAAQRNLGICYENGYGVEKDLTQAVYWYIRAAEQGDAQAMYNLAYCYAHGHGIEPSYITAIHYYKQAIKKEYTSAYFMLSFYVESPSLYHFELLFQYYKRSKHPDGFCCYQLGSYYHNGVYVLCDLKRAIELYQQAAEDGCVYAKNDLGAMHILQHQHQYEVETNESKDLLFQPDPVYAVKLFRQAAQEEYPVAFFNLGYCYQHGVGIYQDIEQAIHWYEKATHGTRAIEQAFIELGNIYGGDETSTRYNIQKSSSFFEQARLLFQHQDVRR